MGTPVHQTSPQKAHVRNAGSVFPFGQRVSSVRKTFFPNGGIPFTDNKKSPCRTSRQGKRKKRMISLKELPLDCQQFFQHGIRGRDDFRCGGIGALGRNHVREFFGDVDGGLFQRVAGNDSRAAFAGRA